MKDQLELCFFGRGCIKTSSGVYVKQSDYDYWEGCLVSAQRISLVLYVSPYHTKITEYTARIDESKFQLRVYAIRNPLEKLYVTLNAGFNILIYGRNQISYFYFPNSINVFPFLVACMVKKTTVSYWGNDWGKVGNLLEKQEKRKLLRWRFYGNIQSLIVRLSSLSIFAGLRLYRKFKPIARRAVETRPFVSFSSEDIYYRSETDLNEVVRILYVGTFTERKGVWDLLDVTEQLARDGLNVAVTMVGGGSFRKK